MRRLKRGSRASTPRRGADRGADRRRPPPVAAGSTSPRRGRASTSAARSPRSPTIAARPSARPAVDLIIEESPDALLVFRRGMSEEAFEAVARRSLAHPAFMVASDGIYHGARPHPRGYGCYAQILGHFVRDLGAVTLERAVRQMSAPAGRALRHPRSRPDRRGPGGRPGRLRSGDGRGPGHLGRAANCRRPASTRVVVNGRTVVEAGQPTAARPGVVVRGTGRG